MEQQPAPQCPRHPLPTIALPRKVWGQVEWWQRVVEWWQRVVEGWQRVVEGWQRMVEGCLSSCQAQCVRGVGQGVGDMRQGVGDMRQGVGETMMTITTTPSPLFRPSRLQSCHASTRLSALPQPTARHTVLHDTEQLSLRLQHRRLPYRPRRSKRACEVLWQAIKATSPP